MSTSSSDTIYKKEQDRERILSQNQNDEADDSTPEMELDFHVEFPTPTFSDDEESICPSSKSGENDKSTVLVVLLGWAGARDKYLSKYSDFYLKRGCIVLRYITPIKTLTFDASKLPIIANRLVSLLQDLQLSSHPTFFHVFSNGGSFLYSHILQDVAFREISNEFDFRGVIFDSAPAPRKVSSLYKAVKNMFQHYPRLKYLIAIGMVMVLITQIFWYHIQSAFSFCITGDKMDTRTDSSPKRKRKLSTTGPPLHNWLKRISLVRNHTFLFIYSDEDEIISSIEVEKLGFVLRDRGNDVTLHKFQGSEHVQHYRAYPKEYIELVTKFIRKTMERTKETDRMILWNER